MTSTRIVHAPRIHLNGTGKAQLIGAYEIALDAVKAAYEALKNTAPNGRDYYTESGDALKVAQDEHRGRLLACDNLMNQLDALIGAIEQGEVIGEYQVTE